MRPWVLLIIFGFVCVGIAKRARGQTGEKVEVSAGINHDNYDRLLKKYVNEQGLVNYGAWKQNQADVFALDGYLKQFAAKPDTPAQGNEGSDARERLQRVNAALDFDELSDGKRSVVKKFVHG